jgi:MFS family permease
MKGTFRSLNGYNYRLWAGGALISNIGTWMQRTAQDWLVLTGLTHHNAVALGIVMALQFGPMLLFVPWTGSFADRFDKRKLLLVTQGSMGVLALALGILTITGHVQLWHVYVFAFLLGTAAAFDAPVRQTFVAELVGEEDLSNAVALNSTSFNAAQMIGPAVAGLLIAATGSGVVFLINAASFAAVLFALLFLRVHELHPTHRAGKGQGGLVEGFRYVWARPDLKTALAMFFLIGTFGANFPIYVSTMTVSVFHAGAGEYGVITSMMAIGSIIGALFVARRARPHMALLMAGVGFFGAGCMLLLTGIAAQVFTTSTNSLIQLSTEPAMRGRVMAILLAIALGSTPIGAPIVGWVANNFGPRWALGVGALAGFGAALIAFGYILKHGNRIGTQLVHRQKNDAAQEAQKRGTPRDVADALISEEPPSASLAGSAR